MSDQFTLDAEKFIKLYVEPLKQEFQYARESRRELKLQLDIIEQRMTTKDELATVTTRINKLEDGINSKFTKLEEDLEERFAPIERKDQIELAIFRTLLAIGTGLAIMYFGGFFD